MNAEEILAGLNPEQLRAVKTIDGPLLIQAGAGSGKTKTLTHRIAYLIATGRARPAEILAVTFTNKAAGEMRERLAKLLGAENTRSFMPWTGTFHSIAVKLLRIYGEVIGIPSNFVIFDESDRKTMIKSILRDLGASDRQYNPRTIISYISNAKNECLTPDEYYRTAGRTPIMEMSAEVYERYARRMKENSALDFDDLLLETVRLLTQAPDVREKLQQRFKFILIDEYQDTNKAQYKIVKLLLNDHCNICAVGDDWQSIYSWRGADFTNILNFERDFPGATVIKLEQNYRSTEQILDAAHNVIVQNTQRSDKKLWTDRQDGDPVRIIEARNEFDEAEKISNEIQSSIAVGEHNYHDFAILYRTNAQSRVFEQTFLRDEVPYRIIGGLRFYDRAEVKDLIAYLKLLYQPHDTISFQRIVNVPKRGIGEVSVRKFNAFIEQNGYDVLEGLSHATECGELTPRACKTLHSFGEIMKDIASQAKNLTPDKVLEKIISATHYDTCIDDGSDQGEAKKDNVSELISMAKEYGDLASFLEEVALISGADTTNNDDAVTLMTLHAAKGLEFPAVYMVGMEDGLFPSARASYDPAGMEEERRLCYVGMTRAMEDLTLTWADRRTLHGEIQYNIPSPFLADASGGEVPSSKLDGVDDEVSYDYDEYSQPNQNDFYKRNNKRSKPADDDEPYYESLEEGLSIGDKVSHRMFGVGQVTSIDGSVIGVYFKKDGRTRKLNTAFAPLKKL